MKQQNKDGIPSASKIKSGLHFITDHMADYEAHKEEYEQRYWERCLTDPTCMYNWYPKVKDLVPTPKTELLRTDIELFMLADGEIPKGIEYLYNWIHESTIKVGGYPVFLRTGQTSNKHDWVKSCYLQRQEDIPSHVYNLVEFSGIADMIGLPVLVWAVRELLPTIPVFHVSKGMPMTKEFRFFVEDGKITHWQPYWPPEAINKPTVENWQELLTENNSIDSADFQKLSDMTILIGNTIGGAWSVDWLYTRWGYYMIDMAEAYKSYKYKHLTKVRDLTP